MNEVRYIHIDNVEYTVSVYSTDSGTDFSVTINGQEVMGTQATGQDQVVITGIDSSDEQAVRLGTQLAYEVYGTENVTFQ